MFTLTSEHETLIQSQLATGRYANAGLGLQLHGIPAHLVRRMIYLLRMPTFDHQVKVGLNWITKPATGFLKSLTRSS